MPGPPDLYTFQADWSAGIVRDVARDKIPANGMYECRNMLPGLVGAALRKRAGWTYASNAISSYIQAGIHAPYLTGDQLIIVDSAGLARQVNTSTLAVGSGTSMGTQLQNPVFFKDGVIFGQGSGGSYSRDSSGFFNSLGLNFNYCVAHKDRLVVANIAGNENRVIYSDANVTTFAGLADNFFDFPRPITGLASLRNGVLVFMDTQCYILNGTTPGADGDISESFLFPVGLQSAFSITYWNDNVIWANAEGVFMSDGASLLDLTAAGGIKTAWSMPRTDLTGTGAFSFPIAAGVVGDHLVVSGYGLSFSPTPTWVCYLPNRSWYRFTNYNFRTYFGVSPGSMKGLYGGSAVAGRLCQVGQFDTPSTTADADTTAVIPYVETRFFHPYTLYRRRIIELAMSRMRFAFVSYVLRYPSTPPTLTVTAQTHAGTLAQGASTARTEGSSSSTQGEGFRRRLFPINRAGSGVWLSLTTDACADFALEKIELQYWPLPRDAVAYG